MEILRKIYTFLIDTIQTFLMAAAVFLVIYVFLFRPFEVKGESMFPSFLNDEYVLTNLITLKFGEPQKGDVVVFKSPLDAEKDYIKRIIGIQGDSIMIKDGSVYVNNVIFNEEQYLNPAIKTYGGAFARDGEAVVVPEDEFFVMGDNRPYSSDSREWGFVKKGGLIGKSFFVYWPLDRMGIIKNPFKE
ncbi:signal peptidase I [Patescibacteria group bacterium]|nr:signal peptidase I [Patescibacteria group bacterium]